MIFQLWATTHLLAMNSIQWAKTSIFFPCMFKEWNRTISSSLETLNVHVCLFGLSFLVMIWQLKCLQVHQYSVARFSITWKISQWTSLGWWRMEVCCAYRSTATAQPGRIGETFFWSHSFVPVSTLITQTGQSNLTVTVALLLLAHVFFPLMIDNLMDIMICHCYNW